MIYFVYKIEVNNIIVYIGRTNNIHRRTLEHNRAIKKGVDKGLYNYIRDNGLEAIKLVIVNEFKNKVDSKRMEMFLILEDYFGDRLLIQKVPNISDR